MKLDIKVNGENVDALSTICHREQAYYKGQGLTKKLKEFIPGRCGMWPFRRRWATRSRHDAEGAS